MKRLAPLALFVLAGACTPPSSQPAPAAPAAEPVLLIDTVVEDPNFRFEAWREVTLELNITAPEQRGAVQVEILDAEGQTLFVGVAKDLVTEARLSVSAADQHVTVLVGAEQNARALQVNLDAPRIAVAL